MLKWIALILVTSVLCWGIEGQHASGNKAKPEITDRVSGENTKRPGRPVVKEQPQVRQELEMSDDISDSAKAELEELIDQLDQVTTSQGKPVGEQVSEGLN